MFAVGKISFGDLPSDPAPRMTSRSAEEEHDVWELGEFGASDEPLLPSARSRFV